MVSDLLDISWEIMTKEEIERTKGVNLNFLEYLSIKQSIRQFIRNADKRRVNLGPYRPYMLNLVFSQKKGCQDIYRKTGQYGVKILLEISQKWEIDLTVNVIQMKFNSQSDFSKKQLEICICGTFNINYGMPEWLQIQGFTK